MEQYLCSKDYCEAVDSQVDRHRKRQAWIGLLLVGCSFETELAAMLGRPPPKPSPRLFRARRCNLLLQGNRELRPQQQWHSSNCSHRTSLCLSRQRFLPEP